MEFLLPAAPVESPQLRPDLLRHVPHLRLGQHIEAEEKFPELLASQCEQLLTRHESLLADVKIVGELEPYVEVLHAPVEGIVFAGLPPSVGCLVRIYTSRK